jgi:hypothetical protein
MTQAVKRDTGPWTFELQGTSVVIRFDCGSDQGAAEMYEAFCQAAATGSVVHFEMNGAEITPPGTIVQ